MAKRHSFARTQVLVNQASNINLRRKTTVSAAAITGDATLTAAQSGDLITVDVSGIVAGITITLPPPSVGLNYKFVWVAPQAFGAGLTVTLTCDSPEERIVGVAACASGSYVYEYAFNSASIVVPSPAGTGTILEVVCAGGGNWLVTEGISDKPIEPPA